MALGGRGLSSGRGASLVGSDTGLSSGIGGLQVMDVENGIHLNFGSNVHYRKAAGSPAVFSAFTSLFTFTGGNQGTFRNKSGYIVQATTNQPRLDHDHTGRRLGILIEITKTNLCLQSETFGTTWVASGATVSSDATTAPSNTVVADKLVEASGGTFHLVRQDITVTANTPHVFSIFVSSGGRTFCRVQLSDNTEANGSFIDVNLSTGATGSVTNFGTGSNGAVRIKQYAFGFWRIELRSTIDASSTTARVQVLSASALGTVNYSGDGSSGINLYGGQLEAGSFASSYIPTTTLAVARTTDSVSRALSTEWLATAGTIAIGFQTDNSLTSTFATAVAVDDGTTNDRLFIFRNNTATKSHGCIDGGVSQFNAAGGNDGSTYQRSSMAFAAADMRACIGGTVAGTVSSGTLPTVTTFRLGNTSYGADFLNGHIRFVSYWPERVNNNFLLKVSG